MKHWCYYANVVRYLEKLEANAVKKKKRGADLVWTDDEGPHMIAGPDIYWHRGAGPMPDLQGLDNLTRPPAAASVSKRSAPIARSTPPTGAARVSRRSPAAVLSTPEKRTKSAQLFLDLLKSAHRNNRGVDGSPRSRVWPFRKGRGGAKALAGSVEQGLGERVLEFLGLHVVVPRGGEAAEMTQAFAP